MKLTPNLSVRSFLSKLHPPLPSSPRDSQKLVSVLQSAFKRQLDEDHPPVRNVNPLKSPASTSLLANLPNPSADATDSHLVSILHHPLLTQSHRTNQSPIAPADRVVAMFDKAMIDGMMTPISIEVYVILYTDATRKPSSIPQRQRLAPRIASWFTSSEAQTRESFLTQPKLISIVPTMYYDGCEEVVWEWLRMMYEGDFGGNNPLSAYNPASHTWQAYEGRLIYSMIQESIRRGDLTATVQEYFQACGYATTSGRVSSKRPRPPFQLNLPLTRVGMKIIAAILPRRHTHGIPAQLFDKLLETELYYPEAISTSFLFLGLYHPTSPTGNSLYEGLRSYHFQGQKLRPIRLQGEKQNRQRAIAMLDGAQLLLEQGQPSKAQFILDETEKHFPDIVSQSRIRDNRDRIQHARREIAVNSALSSDLALG